MVRAGDSAQGKVCTGSEKDLNQHLGSLAPEGRPGPSRGSPRRISIWAAPKATTSSEPCVRQQNAGPCVMRLCIRIPPKPNSSPKSMRSSKRFARPCAGAGGCSCAPHWCESWSILVAAVNRSDLSRRPVSDVPFPSVSTADLHELTRYRQGQGAGRPGERPYRILHRVFMCVEEAGWAAVLDPARGPCTTTTDRSARLVPLRGANRSRAVPADAGGGSRRARGTGLFRFPWP